MNRAITQKFDRLKAKLDRIRDDLRVGDPLQAKADTAELAEIARRLHDDFAEVAKQREPVIKRKLGQND
jgi:hypothetical protein